MGKSFVQKGPLGKKHFNSFSEILFFHKLCLFQVVLKSQMLKHNLNCSKNKMQ